MEAKSSMVLYCQKFNMKISSFLANKMQLNLLLIPIMVISMASADLQNPDFEVPPTNLPVNSTAATFVLLNDKNNTIPGWSFEGTVSYVTAGPTISLPGNGHAIQLGQDGKINQTLIATSDFMNYILTFTIAPGGQNCTMNADIVVSAPDSHAVFSLKKNYGNETWESYGHFFGNFGDKEPINLVIQSQVIESDSNSTCWPVIDSLLLKKVGTLVQGKNNLLFNGGFESGPEFLTNSKEGVLLDTEPSPVESALQQWSVIGTVKYIDSKNYFVPEGNAAIEIISGNSTGVQLASMLTEGASYNLDFTLGDANDSCIGDFTVGAQVGLITQNITVPSNGTGSAKKFSVPFNASSGQTLISFVSYSTSKTKDGVLCGPVVDDVVLEHISTTNGAKLNRMSKFSGLVIFVLVIVLLNH